MYYGKLEELKRRRRLSNKDMAGIIGISGQGYSDMMAKRTAKVEYIEKFAEYFKLPITYFFDEEIEYPLPDSKPIAQEPTPTPYQAQPCELCEAKEETIQALKQTIDILREQAAQNTAVINNCLSNHHKGTGT